MKFLIIRFSSIGDIVLTTPVIRCLKQQVAGAEVHYLTKRGFKAVLENNPYIDKMHLLGDDLEETIQQLQKENFDYIIDLHKNLRTLKVKRALNKVKSVSFNKLNIQKWFLTAFKINMLPPVHIVDRYLQTIKKFGVENDGKGLDYFIHAKDIVKEGRLPSTHQNGFIGIVIGAALNTKKLPVKKLEELCRLINYPIVLMGGPEDAVNAELIATVDQERIYIACGKFNINQSADLVRKAKAIITHDTGLMHIAAAFKKPIYSVWGNTVPEFGMTPYYGNETADNKMFEVKPLYCRPCSKIGYSKCPLGHFKCMNNQDIEAIALAVKQL
ncbi:MAG: ADP-heptose--lipooligosaccharide heptosyltransferase [Chitinophagaceae bacterium]|nr:ADP-heptose--lipooligosaccharide heptosyltransferase [Chitinophagaceae bacterium]